MVSLKTLDYKIQLLSLIASMNASVDLTVNFISDSLQKISDGDFFGLLGTLTTFQSSLPQDVQEALMQNGEIQELFAQYGATNFDLETIATEIGGYGFDHLDVLNSDGISADNSYNSGDYNGVGQEAGVILQAALSGN